MREEFDSHARIKTPKLPGSQTCAQVTSAGLMQCRTVSAFCSLSLSHCFSIITKGQILPLPFRRVWMALGKTELVWFCWARASMSLCRKSQLPVVVKHTSTETDYEPQLLRCASTCLSYHSPETAEVTAEQLCCYSMA